jgi:DNA-binding transcriptional LysR family regulator
MALAGHGIPLLDDYTVRQDIRAGRLLRPLPRSRVTNTGFALGIYVVLRQTSLLPAKPCAFLDFLVKAIRRAVCRCLRGRPRRT